MPYQVTPIVQSSLANGSQLGWRRYNSIEISELSTGDLAGNFSPCANQNTSALRNATGILEARKKTSRIIARVGPALHSQTSRSLTSVPESLHLPYLLLTVTVHGLASFSSFSQGPSWSSEPSTFPFAWVFEGMPHCPRFEVTECEQ